MSNILFHPGAYWFGVSYEHDMAFADRLCGKKRDEFIKIINQLWFPGIETQA